MYVRTTFCLMTMLVCLLLALPYSNALAGSGATIPDDLNGDGKVNEADLLVFAACFRGPLLPHNGFNLCIASDSTLDGHVDLHDVANLQRCFSGDGLASSDCTVRPIEEGLAGQCIGGHPPDPTQTPGNDLHRVTIDNSTAVCNDGTPAVMYIRAAANAAAADKWVIYLEGGGSCDSGLDCMLRWCGNSAVYSAAKMSSKWSYNAIAGQGIFNRDESLLASANLVFMYYCSSDGWAGQSSNVVLTNELNPAQSYQVHFRGHDILKAAVNKLKAGATTSDDGMETVPNLANAASVLFAGTSAGSAGVRYNADWLSSQFDPAQTDVFAVIDAAFSPSSSLALDPTPIDAAHRDYAETVSFDLQRGFVDQSCLSYFFGSDERWRCADLTYVTLNHVTTPYFVRMDLTDSNAVGNWEPYGATESQFADATRATLQMLPDVGTLAVESAMITRTPGGYGPNCGQHVSLTTDRFFLLSTVDDSSGAPTSFDQALRSWLTGNDVLILDENPAATSVCP